MSLTFRGGIHLPENKNTDQCTITRPREPAYIRVPMSQHIGLACIPVVKPGEVVSKGQLIGENNNGLSACIHAGIAGKVLRIESAINQNGRRDDYIVIENDYSGAVSPDIKPCEKKISELSSDEIIDTVRRAGIVGMGGATFPTHAKIKSAIGKAQKLIINCAECEPYLTANHRLIAENAKDIIYGAKILLKACGVTTGYIAIEDNKPDAIADLKKLLKGDSLLSVKVLKTKYPQGDERQLIYAFEHKELPAGKLPSDLGYVVFNAETCFAVYRAFSTGMPVTERVVTVDGDCIVNPGNVIVPIGTPFSDIINFCGGFSKRPDRIISGGPMMGIAQWDENAPVTKGTAGILALSKDMYHREIPNCIHCGRCVGVCPMHLMPCYFAAYSKINDYESCDAFGVKSCVECGCCTYVCPGNIPIIQYIRIAKSKLTQKK
ncbi:MAG: electron transport complex subunit RsxC [Oscillospiraceae bacterium]|nr:electron transport complex subunit RsxC [Oscillospiraceae bacterium]